MRIATWNVNSLAVRLPQVLDWLSAHQPDALCLQETKLTDDKFPRAEIEAAGRIPRDLSVAMGEAGFSVELCGGTHVARTGDIGLLRITSEAGVAAGVRRIEARTGEGALAWLNAGEQTLLELADAVKGNRDSVAGKVRQLLERQRELEKELDKLKSKVAASAGNDLVNQAELVGQVQVLASVLDGADAKSLRDTVDQLRNKLGQSVVVLATVQDGKVSLAAGVSADVMTRVKAGELVSYLAAQVGGKGGGRPDMAQGGGVDAAALDAALDATVAGRSATNARIAALNDEGKSVSVLLVDGAVAGAVDRHGGDR